MLTFTITGDAVNLSGATREYIEKRFSGFERFLDDDSAHELSVTVQKATAYTRDDSFTVEARFQIHERDFFVTATAGDVVTAIDNAKEELMREVTTSNAKRRTLFHRGARKLKSMMKGLYRNK